MHSVVCTIEMAQCSYQQCKVVASEMPVFTSVCVRVCAADNAIHLYDTSGSKFDEVKTVEARDVGWSILDVVFR